MATEPITAVEVAEGWIAEPCGCAHHPGDTTPRDMGNGWTVSGQGWRQRWCQTHTDEMTAERLALRQRLFGAD